MRKYKAGKQTSEPEGAKILRLANQLMDELEKAGYEVLSKRGDIKWFTVWNYKDSSLAIDCPAIDEPWRVCGKRDFETGAWS